MTYDFEIVLQVGISHQNADGLSRQNWDLPEIPRQTLAGLLLAREWSPRPPTTLAGSCLQGTVAQLLVDMLMINS